MARRPDTAGGWSGRRHGPGLEAIPGLSDLAVTRIGLRQAAPAWKCSLRVSLPRCPLGATHRGFATRAKISDNVHIR